MPLLNTASKVYLGTTLVKAVYRGTVKVWPSGQSASPPQLIRTGRGASSTSVTIDVTGGNLLFVTRNSSSTSLTSTAGTLMAWDTGGPRRTSVWNVTGVTGNVTITGSSNATWGYSVVKVGSVLAAGAGYLNDTTVTAAPVTLTMPATTEYAVIWWTSNNTATWTVPNGVTMLDVVTTQLAEVSWLLGYMPAVAGSFTTPACDKGGAGISRIKTTGLAAVA